MTARRNPWWTVGAGTIGTALGTGIVINYGISIFAKPIAADFSWSREIISQCLSINLVMNGISALLMGEAISRYGMRRPTAAAILLFGLSLAALSVMPASPSLFYLLFALMGLAGAATTAMPYATVICRLFDKRRGLALGLAVAGGGIGATTLPHIATWLIAYAGWRRAIFVIGLIAATLPTLAVLVWVNRDSPGETQISPKSAAGDWAFLLRSWHFLLIAFAIGSVSVATLGVLPNVIPLVTDKGFTPAAAAVTLSFFGLASWVGRLIVGYVLDKCFAPWVAIVIFLLTGSGCVLLTTNIGLSGYSVAAALVGLAVGAEADLATYLISRYIDPARFSRAAGAMWVLWSWGGGIGIWAVARSYAATGSYNDVFWGFAVLILIAIVGLSRLGPYLYAGPMADEAPLPAVAAATA